MRCLSAILSIVIEIVKSNRRMHEGGYVVEVANSAHLVVIVGLCERAEPVRMEDAASRIQLLAVLLGEFRAERVDRYVECTPV